MPAPNEWTPQLVSLAVEAQEYANVAESAEGSLTYAEQRKVVEYMTTELRAAIPILQSVLQRAEAIDCQPLAAAPSGVSDATVRRICNDYEREVNGAIGFSANRRATNAMRAALEKNLPIQPQPGRVEGMDQSVLLVAKGDDGLSDATLCADQEAPLLAWVGAKMFGPNPLNDDEQRQAREVLDELVGCGAWYPEGDPPLFLFKLHAAPTAGGAS
jgi:hypothetical protein